ncbi:MAG: hypothetical protein ACLU4P_10245 [Ruminococcus sp.]
MSGTNREDGYAVYRIRETAFGGGTKLSAEDGFLQFMIERLLESNAPAEAEEVEDEEEEELGDEMKLTSLREHYRLYDLRRQRHCRTIFSLWARSEIGCGAFFSLMAFSEWRSAIAQQ